MTNLYRTVLRWFGCALLASNGLENVASAENVEPVVRWGFKGSSDRGKWQGSGSRLVTGPQTPIYPKFQTGNQAVELAGKDAALVVPDAPELRFQKGDAITLETWVKVRSIRDGQMVYLLGKGRNGAKEFGDDNQNYALRLKGVNGHAAIGFLFTAEAPAGEPVSWHRWWSKDGFQIDTGWHHVAVTYTFGQKDSFRGYIDGKEIKGTWDLGGATDRGPVSDADELVVGSGYSRGPAQTLDGWLDEVAIYRTALSAGNIKSHFAVEPASVPEMDRAKIPSGRVLVELCEKGVPEKAMWPVESPIVKESYVEDVFGFFEFPQRYISSGVRGDRASALLVRASASVRLPKGSNRLLLRGRGAARLFIDGKPVLQTPFPSRGADGFALLSKQMEYLNLGPDFRFAPPGNREVTGAFEGDGNEHIVVLETIVGGGTGESRYRPELGETVVAISHDGSSAWSLLSPGVRQVSYTDAGWAAYEAERSEHLAKVNAEARALRRLEQQDFWKGRRDASAHWLATTPEVRVPELPIDFPANNEIDHFIGARIAEIAKDRSSTPKDGVDFYRDVQPILEAKCYSCHQGGKAKGGLKLDTRTSALKGGKSDGPAIVPGKPAESALFTRTTADSDEVMPPQGKGDPLNRGELAIIERWISEGAHWPELRVSTLKMTPLTSDLTFLRRVTLDTVGMAPNEEEIRRFIADTSSDKRVKVIDRLLADPRWADRWMGYWQDVLAENPNILNPTLNNTGPFRWWIYESLVDDKPMDLFVTELIRMEGSVLYGGPAGFGMAAQNDVPMAQKAMILSSAFLGVEMKCARCHDSPANLSRQQDLFELAAMLEKKPIKLPVTSSVPMDRVHQGGRKPLIEITLTPGSTVDAKWPFGKFSSEAVAATLAQKTDDSRDQLAALITAPQNTRFAQVIANRFWQQLMGRGLVEPVEDWEKGQPSHPDLLAWLGREFVRSGYSAKALQRLILNSHAYQRQVETTLREQEPLFVSPAPRRLAAEQIVDSLFAATGKSFSLEEMSLDIDGDRPAIISITLGKPRRAWMLASTSNERDRPSLMLPRIQAVSDLMEIFGWNGARVSSISRREVSPNTLQPAVISNGVVGGWLTQLSDEHGLVQLALEDQPVETLVERLFLRLLTRKPTSEERTLYVSLLTDGYKERIIPREKLQTQEETPRVREKYISWSNHVDPEANVLRQKQAVLARQGDAPTKRLSADWRERMEDMVWALVNAPSWITAP